MLHKLLCLIAIALAAAPAQAGGRNRVRCNHNANVNANFNASVHHNGFVQVAGAQFADLPVYAGLTQFVFPVARQTYVNYSASAGGNQVGFNYNGGMNANLAAALQAAQQPQQQPGYGFSCNYQAGYGNAQTAGVPQCPPCPPCNPAPSVNPPAPAPVPAPAPPQPAPAVAPAPTPTPLSMIQQSCVRCHSGAEAKANLDLTKPLTCEQTLKVINAVNKGIMPPDHSLSDADRRTLIDQLSSQPLVK